MTGTPAGKKTARLAFDKRSEAADGYGNTKGDWEEQFRRLGWLHPLKGGEEVMQARLAGNGRAIVTIDRDTQAKLIDPTWRLRHLDRETVWNIRDVLWPDDRPTEIDLLCESGIAAG
ncbi:phage head completion protein [Parvibaculum sp. MBR-TMA-1.3b-4.2]|jgi:head-tail adaptor